MKNLKAMYEKFREGTVMTYTVISNSLKFITKTLNLIPNFQWKSNLNIFQNLAYNFYIPNSSGKPGMHVTLLAIFMLLIVITLCLEMVKFYFVQEYKFSEGFWLMLGGLAAMVKIMFTRDAHIKMEKDSQLGMGSGQGTEETEKEPSAEKQNPPTPETTSESTVDAADLQIVNVKKNG